MTLTFECADDVPPAVLDWMAGNLRQHAENEFENDFDPSFVDGVYDKSPLVGPIDVTIAAVF
jgi:hypothetical protein